jgi:hypothetical protein
MKWLASLFLLFSATTARAADSIWVQATATGYEVRATSATAICPVLHTEAGEVPMTIRAPANEQFPQVCAAPIAPGARGVSVAGQPLVAPVANPERILVLGDTGCRIKGAALQACNDPVQWPFPPLAAAAAKLKPDLILHLGDYHYRESPCPPASRAVPVLPGATIGRPGRRISLPPPRHCWPPRLWCWCAAITRIANAPARAGCG